MDIMTHLDSMTLNTRRLIRCMVDTVHEPLVVLDSDRMILNASAAFCELFRLPRERVVGQPFAIICDRLGPCSPELYHCLNQVATTGIAVRNLQISCYLEDDIACVCHINAQRIDDNVSQPAILLAFRVYQDRREQDTLQEVDRLLQDVADISPDRLWETDEQHRLVWQAENSDNPSGPRPGCIGKRRDEVALTEVNTGEWREHLATLNAHKPFRDFRYCMLIDEEMHWISVSGVPVFDQQGVFRGYRGICSDITAIHEARLQTRRTTERLLYALDIFTEGFAYYDADDRLVACNQKYQHNISIGDELKPGMTFREILTIHLRRQHAFPDAMGREQEWLEERLAHFRNPRGPFDVERTGGLWMRVHEQRLPDGGLLMVITDIADQKRTEQALAESEQRFRDFARSGSDCFWETDAEFRFSWFSDSFINVYRKQGHDITLHYGKTRKEIAADYEDGPYWRRFLARLERHEPFRDFEYAVTTPIGPRRIRTSGVPVFDDHGQFCGYRGVSNDITELQQIRQQALTIENRFVQAIDVFSEAFAYYDADDKLTLFNQQYRELINIGDALQPGMSYAEVLQLQLQYGVIDPPVRNRQQWFGQRMHYFRRPREPYILQLAHDHWVQIHQQRLPNGDYLLVGFDISGQKQAQRALVESEKRFRDFAKAGTDWFWELDTGLRFSWLSENYERITGQPRENVYGKPVGYFDIELNLTNPDYKNKYRNALQAHLPFKDIEVCRMTLQGIKWRRLSGIPIFNDQGEFQGYRGSTTDITELYKFKQNIEHQQRRFSEAVELFDSLFVLFDADNRLLMWNKKYQELLESQEIGHLLVTGVHFETLIDAQLERGLVVDAIGCEQEWRRWRLGQFDNPSEAFDIQVTPDKWFHVRQQRLPDGSLLMAQFDIGQRKRFEEALVQAKHEAENASAMKSRFLATASHDLRQPLQGMRILKDLLGMRFSAHSEVGDIIEEWEKTLITMERLVSGYLDISRLESGSVIPEQIDFPVMTLLAQIYKEFSPQAQTKQLKLRLAACSAVIHSDRLLLGQILRNIVANAINYTDSGTVLIGCRRRADTLSLQIWDSGPGIAEDQQDKIFEEFYQIDNQARSGGGSYGFGLAIAQLTARLLEHPIQVSSYPGRGTMFAVEVPTGRTLPEQSYSVLHTAEVIDYRATDAAALQGNVLLVEDDPIIGRALELLMCSRGFNTVICESGEQALQHLKANTMPTALVITDVRLPGANTGVFWLKRLKQILPSHTPVVVITGDTSPTLSHKAEAMGCTLLTKPVHADELLRLIDQLIQERKTA